MWSVEILKIFFLASCFAFYFFLAQFAFRQVQSSIQEAHDNKWETTDEDFKYILLWSWTSETFAPFHMRGEGQEAYLSINCSLVTKCYFTTDRMFFGGDLTQFDSILFHGQVMLSSDLPKVRSRHQQYIFFSLESADYYPICEKAFDGFFNWTWTYRLDSDIPYPFIQIQDNNSEIVGPKRNMKWMEMVAFDDIDNYEINTHNKFGAVAWCVSNCTKSGRQEFVTALQNALKPYDLKLDVFGVCGNLLFSSYMFPTCSDLLIISYFFYISMENSFDEDYVTEKLLTALRNEVLPIVYGGADYTRFLPPGSYIDARKHNITKLAAKLYKLSQSPEEYSQYFWWKNYYSYHEPKDVENVCALCEALHNKELLNTTKIYYDFRNWWNPNVRCHTNSSSANTD